MCTAGRTREKDAQRMKNMSWHNRCLRWAGLGLNDEAVIKGEEHECRGEAKSEKPGLVESLRRGEWRMANGKWQMANGNS
jgi:hypothetical protein